MLIKIQRFVEEKGYIGSFETSYHFVFDDERNLFTTDKELFSPEWQQELTFTAKRVLSEYKDEMDKNYEKFLTFKANLSSK